MLNKYNAIKASALKDVVLQALHVLDSVSTSIRKKLEQVQRLLWIGATGIMGTSPTTVLEVPFNLPSLHTLVETKCEGFRIGFGVTAGGLGEVTLRSSTFS